MDIIIEEFKEDDIDSIHSLWNEIIDEGESFFWKEHFSREKILDILKSQDVVYCAKDNDIIVAGFYILHSNAPGRGNHISNALYAIRKDYRGKVLARYLQKIIVKGVI